MKGTVIPQTPMLAYFREAFGGPQGAAKELAAKRLPEAARLIGDPEYLRETFLNSVALFDGAYSNYQPFYPKHHLFGSKGTSGVLHGQKLDGTVDVAQRLSRVPRWDVEAKNPISFRYIDREIVPTRANPGVKNPNASVLRVDLFLVDAVDRTPVICEVKVRKDRDALYALVQLITQAVYAVTPSQRERLVLFGSTPEFVLKEALPNKPAPVDLYVMLVDPPSSDPWAEIAIQAIAVGKAFVSDPEVSRFIRQIRWIRGEDDGDGGLTLFALDD